jgi:IclR family transcriptional regulator, acetate operon repressor
MSGNSSEPQRTVTSKTVAILLALTTGQNHTLSTIASDTDLPRSTVYPLLRQLVASPLVECDDSGQYRLGPPLLSLARVTVPPTLNSYAPLIVDDLVGALRSTVRLGVAEAGQVSYIAKEVGPRPGTLFPNRAKLPLHATAMGKALLAFGTAASMHTIAAIGLTKFTPRTITDGATLRYDLLRTRLRGFAISDRELHSAVRAVGVPVLDPRGAVIAAMEVSVADLSERAFAHVIPALSVAAHALARQLDHDSLDDMQDHHHARGRATGQ